MTKTRDKKDKSSSPKDKKDKCFMGVDEASRERQEMIDEEPYS